MTENYTNIPPKYSLEERVRVQGWVSTDFGKVKEIKTVYHNRLDQYVWGYRIEYEGEGAGFAFVFIPEGYLRKL